MILESSLTRYFRSVFHTDFSSHAALCWNLCTCQQFCHFHKSIELINMKLFLRNSEIFTVPYSHKEHTDFDYVFRKFPANVCVRCADKKKLSSLSMECFTL